MNRSGFFRRTGLAALVIAAILPARGVAADDTKAAFKSLALENGLRVTLYRKPTQSLTNLVLAFNVGSKDETDETSGLVHVLEHYILFRGTKHRTGDDIARDIRRHGAYFNAHTGRDLSIFEMTLPSRHVEFALRNQKEILFDLRFDQEELDKEKEVILEEINQTEDDPIRMGASLIFQQLFQGHPYARPIYGNRDVIRGVTVQQIEAFHRRYFVPANASLALVGDMALDEMEVLVRRHFKDLPAGEFEASEFHQAPPLAKSAGIELEMDVNLAYLAIGISAPDFNHPDQYAMDVLTEILGGGVNPMLNHPLMQRRIHANSLRMDYSAFLYGGAALIFVSLDPRRLHRAEREIINYLKKARRLNYSNDDVFGEEQFYAIDYVTSARNRLRFQGESAMEKGLNIAVSLAKYMLLNRLPERGDYSESIASVTSSDLREAANRHLSRGKYITIRILPKKGDAPQ